MNKDCQILETDKNTIRILYVNGGILDLGGISSYMINYFRHIDKSVCHIDFAVHGNKKGVYDDEIENAGSVIYHLPIKSCDYFGNVRALKKILQEGNYDIIHSHLDAGSYHILKIAKQCGVPIRIAHSHNTDFLTSSKLKLFINEYYRKNLRKVATDFMACSSEAGKWLFGEKSNFTVVRNAIELDKYKFSAKSREKIRKQLGLEEKCIVLGHVGRFDTQKNHSFLIDFFAQLIKKNQNYRLICVGDGHLRNKIESKAKELGVYDYICFVGYTENVECFYSAFDIFVFPSLFEGLGIVAVEAQCAGLPCILSDAVPKEAVVMNSVKRVSLNEKEWCNAIEEISVERIATKHHCFESKGYDIQAESNKLQLLYSSLKQHAIR